MALWWAAAALLMSPIIAAQNVRDILFPQQIAGPAKPADFPAWLANLQAWRAERLVRMGYSPALYEHPRLAWSQRNFFQPQMMIEERYFYDPVAGRYTVDRYLDDLDARYGGIDSVLLWTFSYPNIGIDDRRARTGIFPARCGSTSTANTC